MTRVDPQEISATRPRPMRRTWLRNTWQELSFLHWSYDPETVQRLLPDGLHVDTFDERGWVSLIPFEMTDASPRGLPAIPWISRFLETNVRTYVVDSAGNRGIWFFSLEASRLGPVVFARALLGFPYIWSEMSFEANGDRRRYATTRRRWPRTPMSSTLIELDIGAEIDESSDLDVFLTARWGTVARWGGRLRHHPVDHDEWRLHAATLVAFDDRSLVAAGLPHPAHEPVVRWTRSVDARFARPQRV